MKLTRQVAMALPLLLSLAGLIWMTIALAHFEDKTSRGFYGLAGYHYSMPVSGFEYRPGGEHIERWTIFIPAAATLALMLVSAVALTVAFRREKWFVASLWMLHIVASLAFLLATGWYWIHVTGVFI
jgi:hypothetical protein